MDSAASAVAEHSAVHVYYANIRSISAAASAALVTEKDQERLAHLTHPRRRTEYLAGRALLRYALQHWSGLPARAHRLRAARAGKPKCIGGPAISVSHSGDLVACAVSPAGCVGIDVQFPVAHRHTAAIARRYFSPDESAWAARHNDRFYMLWVLKEAYLKAVGSGLAGGLDALQCRVEPPVIESTSAQAASLALYSMGSAFLAVASTGYRFSELRVESWNPDAAVAADSSRFVAMTV